MPAFLFVWWLVNCSPNDVVYKLYHKSPFSHLFAMVNTLNRIKATTSGFERGMMEFPQNLVGVVAYSIICGLAGGVAVSWMHTLLILRNPDDSRKAPTNELTHSTWSGQSVLWGALFLGGFAYPHFSAPLLSSASCGAVLVIVAFSVQLYHSLTGTNRAPPPFGALNRWLPWLLRLPRGLKRKDEEPLPPRFPSPARRWPSKDD